MANKNKHDSKKEERVINPNIAEDLMHNRYDEAEGIIQGLYDFPGSTREELWQLNPSCDDCFNRVMAWLESAGIIHHEGDYYYLSEEE